MLKFVNNETGKVVMTEKDNGDVEFHVQEDAQKSKEQEEGKK